MRSTSTGRVHGAARGAFALILGTLAVLAACSTRPPLQRAPLPANVSLAPSVAHSTVPPPAADDLAGPPSASAPAPTPESAALAARFPDPPVAYRTPAFEAGRPGFTDNADLRTALRGLVRSGDGSAGATTVALVQAGSSQQGVPLEALLLSRNGASTAAAATNRAGARPTVLLVGQQHGDEPAGAEALLVIAERLADGELGAVLDRIDVLILPRANPDGAAADRRTTASGIDANRDHLLLRTPEAQAQAQLVRDYNPLVVVDAHEYAALGRYVDKFGAAQRFDALVQYAMVANLPDLIGKAAEEWFRQPMLQALQREGLTSEWYYTTSQTISDKKVSMGGVQPDNGRNVHGLRNAISFLVETRGGGLGKAHLARRVHTHVVAITSVLQNAAARVADLQRLRRYVDGDVAGKACRGQAIVEATATPSEYDLRMLDPVTGADRVVAVTWDSALELTIKKRRARPCGYWLGGDQTDAALRLRGLGLQVQRLDEDGEFRGEAYAEIGREAATRDDVRGMIADGGTEALKLKVQLVPALLDVRAGGYYIGLDQPLAHLAIAALEPDTQSSFAAHRIVTDVKFEARVMARPAVRMTPLP